MIVGQFVFRPARALRTALMKAAEVWAFCYKCHSWQREGHSC